MLPTDAFGVFDSLTEKQHATLVLAARHLTSKQIAIALGVAPVTIDKRIEAVRSRLGSLPRSDLLRLYAEWRDAYGRAIDEPIILGGEVPDQARKAEQSREFAYAFEDSISFDARASWERKLGGLHPGIRPSDLSISGKLLLMLGGAVAIMMVAVLSMAFADALMSILER